jgi:hypothetical protein
MGILGAIAMMGPKKLSTIRQELKQAITSSGRDPIQWLEERIQALEAAGKPEPDVLQSLRRLLEKPKKPRRRTGKTSAKK